MKNEIKRVDTPHGRIYMVKHNGTIMIYPSVTTVLSSEANPWLDNLKNEIGEEALLKISQRAANRGTVMHTYLENYLVCLGYRGISDDCLLYSQKKSIKDLGGQFDNATIEKGRNLFYGMLESNLFKKMKKPLFAEKFLWSHDFGFAGTADFGYEDVKITEESDGDVLGDFKSSNSPRGEEQISKYKKQLGAYSIAYEERTGKIVKRAEIWISHPEGIQEIVLQGEDLETAKADFINLCKNYHKNWNKKQIFDYLKSLSQVKND